MKPRTALLPLSVLLVAGAFVGVARAGDDCTVPMSQWQPRENVAALAATLGWNVRRIKIDDGCFEVIGRDKDGHRIEVKLNPATLAVIEFEYEDEDHDLREDHEEHRSDNDN